MLWEMDDEAKIGTITLNSPKDYNALSMEMGDEFMALCRQLTDHMHDELDCRVVILQGAGDHAFSAGGHLEWLKSFGENTAHRNVDLMLQFYKKFLSVRQLPVPVVAALSGPAMGAGAGLALACDLRTAANKSKVLGLNFARLGIHSVRTNSYAIVGRANLNKSVAVCSMLRRQVPPCCLSTVSPNLNTFSLLRL